MKETRKAKLLKRVIDHLEYLKQFGPVIEHDLVCHSSFEASLWVVFKNDDKQWVDVYFIDYVKSIDDWVASHSYNEIEGIFDYSCPLKFLEMTPEITNPYYEEDWRERVKEFHSNKGKRK